MRLRHEATFLSALESRPDLDPIRSALPRVIGLFDADEVAGTPSEGWGCGLVVNRFPGTNAFRAWLAASGERRRRWIFDAVLILRAVHGVIAQAPNRTVSPDRAPSYVSGWYGTRIDDGGRDWREAHRRYLAALRGILATTNVGKHRALVTASLEACESRLDALRNVFGPRPGHGDFHLHNIIVDGDAVAGVIDWEWAGNVEPDADVAHLLRWSLFPAHPADEDLESLVVPQDFAAVAPAVWAAYPELATVPDLEARLYVYLVEHDLHQLTYYPDSTQAVDRLEAWHEGSCGSLVPS